MEINDLYVNYILYGNSKKDTIVLLHGWGQNIDMMRPLGDAFADNYQILIIDLPGFGGSDIPKRVWSLDDYVLLIKMLLDKLKIKNPIVLGHSFGGKLALLYASQYDTKKAILFAPPINHNHKVSLKSKVLKSIKKLPLMNGIGNYMKKYIGSTDYKNANPMMRDILVEHIKTDIYDNLSKINVPTLIVWGESDTEVDPSVAHEISNQIKDSGVVMLPGTHYAYLENLNRVIEILKIFLKED